MTVSGWFADPGGQANTFRWWNGEAWTRWLSADPSAPDPGPEPSLSGPAPPPTDDHGPALADPLDLAALPPPDPADRVVRLPAAAAIVVAVVLLAVIAVGAIVSITEDRPLTGPPVDPPPPTQAPAEVAYDPATRTVSFEEMQFTAPAAPFTCEPKPQEVLGLFRSGFGCEAVVHRNYDKNRSWINVVSMGQLEDRLQASGDLASIASQTFTAILRQNYLTTKATVKKRKTQKLVGVAPDGKALLVSAEVHVSVPGLPTDYDRVIAAVVELESGQHAAWYALRANDSPKKVVQAMEDSANTVTAR